MQAIGTVRQSTRFNCQNLHVENEVAPGQRVGEIDNDLGIRDADDQARYFFARRRRKTKHLSGFQRRFSGRAMARRTLRGVGLRWGAGTTISSRVSVSWATAAPAPNIAAVTNATTNKVFIA